MAMNIVCIQGNLTRDPEVRYTPSGAPIAQFSVAVNRVWRDEQGQQHEEVSFIDCDAWNKTAENIAQYFRKGKPILVEGRLKQDTWDDRETGQKRHKLKVVVNRFHFVGGKDDGGQQNGGGRHDQTRGQTQQAEAPQRDAPADYAQQAPVEDDVPF